VRKAVLFFCSLRGKESEMLNYKLRDLCLFVICCLFLRISAFALDISSDAFSSGGKIPTQYTCDSSNISPGLSWENVPFGTKTFVLICDDPDAPGGNWIHWVVFNIPFGSTGLNEDISKTAILEDGTIQGVTDFGKIIV